MQSPEPDNSDPFVAFVPSKVSGLADVSEARIFKDRIALRVGNDLQEFRYMDFAPGREIGSGRIPIGEWHYFKESAKSYFVFYTSPRISVHLPADAPTKYPDGYFWRVQDVLRGTPFRFYDEFPVTIPPVRNYSKLRTALYVIALFGIAWLLALAGELPGDIGRMVRDFWTDPPKPNIGALSLIPTLVLPIVLGHRHGRTSLYAAISVLASTAVLVLHDWLLRRLEASWIPFDTTPHVYDRVPSIMVIFPIVFVATFGFALGRYQGLEPIRRPNDNRRT